MSEGSSQQQSTQPASQPAAPASRPAAPAPPLVPLPKPTVPDVILTKQADNGKTETR